MTVSFVQTPVVSCHVFLTNDNPMATNDGVCTIDTPFNTGTTPGNSILIIAWGQNLSGATTGSTATDSSGNTYTLVSIAANSTQSIVWFEADNALSVPNTGWFKVTLAGSPAAINIWGFTVYELSTSYGSGKLLANASGNGAVSAAAKPTCTIAFPSAPSGICIQVAQFLSTSNSVSVDTGWTFQDSENYNSRSMNIAYQNGTFTTQPFTVSHIRNIGTITTSMATALTIKEITTNSYVYTGTGGISFAGSASVKFGWSYAPSGGIVFSGTPVQLHRSIYITGSGGIVFGGSAIAKLQKQYVASGGILLSGTAVKSLQKKYSTSGGIALSGSASYSRKYLYAASGGIVFGGSAGVFIPRFYTGNGGIVFGGFAITNGPSVIGLGPIPYQPGDTRWAPNVGRK